MSYRVFGPRFAAAFRASVLGLAGALLATHTVWGHTDPPGANATGIAGGLVAFRDAAGTVPVVGPVTECETIFFRASLTYQPVPVPGSIGAAFEAGQWQLVLPSGSIVDITPAAGVPCVGGTTNDPNSGSNAGPTATNSSLTSRSMAQ